MTKDEMAGWHHWMDVMDVSLSELRELVMDKEACHAAFWKGFTNLNGYQLYIRLSFLLAHIKV